MCCIISWLAISTVMFYISGSSVRTAVEFPIKWLEQRSKLVKTEKVMTGKALKFVGIKCDLNTTSRRVLNTPARGCGKIIFDCQI